ncbi:MAG: RHS repeat-associated core domain-containing protein [Candidatus Dormibacteria bacterium]
MTPAIYTYSGNNELLSSQVGSSTTDFTYNHDDEMTSLADPSGTTSFTFDAQGNRTSMTPPTGTATSYSYDEANQLVGVSGPTAAGYSYNGDGLRMSKTVNGATDQFTWDDAGSLPLLLEDGTSDFIYGPGGLTLEQITGSTPSYFLHDWQGNTTGLVSQSGALVASYTYDAYGNLTSSSGTATTPLLFQGQYLDSETGFYYLLSRYYDPTTAQFLSRDPGSALVPYAYAVGDAINAADPSGQMISRGTVGSGTGFVGPTVVAPPPSAPAPRAAYNYAITRETTPAPPPPPQVRASVAPAAAQPVASAPVAAAPSSAHSGCSGFCPGQWLGAAGGGFEHAAGWVQHHPWQTVGLAAGVVAAATGVGALAEGASVLGITLSETALAVTSVTSGGAAAVIDGTGCIGDHLIASCVGMALGGVGTAGGLGAELTEGALRVGLGWAGVGMSTVATGWDVFTSAERTR